MSDKRCAIEGCLLGTAVGDALGLAGEGLSRHRLARLFPDLTSPNLSRPHFLGRRGMVSDDTEHTCFVAQALIQSAGEPEAFTRALAWRLRFWLLGGPAGIGWATLRAILKLWLGVPPGRSGVWSAGNGPAMRSALLGVCHGDDPQRLRELVRASSRLTHTDFRAEAGALAVALAAYHASVGLPHTYGQSLERLLEPGELRTLLGKAVASVEAGETTDTFAASIGAGRRVTGYVNQTVPVAVHAWLSFPDDYKSAVLAVIRCGGDTDTTAAVTGAIVGAAVGTTGIPDEWLSALAEWPRTITWMKRLSKQVAEVQANDAPQKPLGLPALPLLGRNLLFTLVVLAHGFRRGLPPY